MLIEGVKANGTFPCPFCLINKCSIHQLGTREEEAFMQLKDSLRQYDEPTRKRLEEAIKGIFKDGRPPDSDFIGQLLNDGSWAPVIV